MQPPIFTLPHPSIHSAFDDHLPQLPPIQTATHPLNLSNHSDQSKHSRSTSHTHSLSTNTPTYNHNNNNNNTHNNINPFTNNKHDPSAHIYASPPNKATPIFDQNERWTNTNFFSPGHEEIIGAWQTMFPLQEQPQTPPHNTNTHTQSPYKKSRPTPLCIPHPDTITNIPTQHTNLTADLNDIQLMDNPLIENNNHNNHNTRCVSAPIHHNNNVNYVHIQHRNDNNNAYLSNLTLPNLSESQLNMQYNAPSQKYDVCNGENHLFPHHSVITQSMNISSLNNAHPIIPYHDTSMQAYPTRIALPIVPAAYQNIHPSFWQKHQQNNVHKFANSNQSYLNYSYNPYFPPLPNSAPPIPNTQMRVNMPNVSITSNNNNTHTRAQSAIPQSCNNNNNNDNKIKPKIKVKRKRGRPRKYKRDADDKIIRDLLHTPPPKKRKMCRRSADRKNLEFMQYFAGDGTGPEMQIEDLSPQKNRNGCTGPNAKGFQRGGLRHNKKNNNVLRIIGGRDKSYKKPPCSHAAYNRIRIWKDNIGRQFYDCICNARKPVQDLNKIKSHVLGHDKIVWVCDICGREFFNNHLQLNAHMKTHKKREIKAGEQPIIK